jgi:hypothetical protein
VKTIYLIVVAVILGFLGLVYLIAPSAYLGMLGLSLSDPSALNMLRSYGGFYIAFAGFLVFCSRRPAMMTAAVMGVVFIMGGLVGGRILGFVVEGSSSRPIVMSTVIEILLLSWGGFLLKRGGN